MAHFFLVLFLLSAFQQTLITFWFESNRSQLFVERCINSDKDISFCGATCVLQDVLDETQPTDPFQGPTAQRYVQADFLFESLNTVQLAPLTLQEGVLRPENETAAALCWLAPGKHPPQG